MGTKHTHEVVIAGGGMVGLTLALALAQRGFNVAVVERNATQAMQSAGFDGRVSAVALSSRHLLHHLGMWETLKTHGEPIYDIRVSDGSAPVFLHYDHKEVGKQPFGWIVENRHIVSTLLEKIKLHDSVTLYENSEVLSYSEQAGGVEVALKDGIQLEGALLIAADGKFSRLRTLAGIETLSSDYKQTAIVCTIHHSEPHNGLAQERFLAAGPFAVLPMQENCSSLVWVEPENRAPHYLALSEETFVEEIRKRTGEYLGDISLKGERFSYPLSYTLASRYHAGRLVLIGDAAHAIHPIAGQGVNLGFRDVAVLTELLQKQKDLGLDIASPSILLHYQRWRRFDNMAMFAVTDGLNRLFSTSHPLVTTARRLGMRAVGAMPLAKKYFMLHAMGQTGDMPPLLTERGE